MSEVDPELASIPLAAYCFMTGWMCAALTHLLSFSRNRLVSYIAQRCSIFLCHIRLVRLPNWQLAAGVSSFPPTSLVRASGVH